MITEAFFRVRRDIEKDLTTTLCLKGTAQQRTQRAQREERMASFLASFSLIVNFAYHIVVPMKSFRLNRSAFSMGTHGQNARRDAKYWSARPFEERLAAAAYLNSIAYGYSQDSPLRLDRTVHSTRKR